MRNLAILLIAILVLFACKETSAQDRTLYGKSSADRSYSYVKAAARDSIGDGQDTVEVVFLLPGTRPVLSDINVYLDATTVCTVDDSVKIEPFGKIFESDDYASIGTAVYYQCSADTTVTFQEHSTADYIRYLMVRISHIGSAGTATLGGDDASDGRDAEVKLWQKGN